MTIVAMPACAAGGMSNMDMGDMKMSAAGCRTDAEVIRIDAAHGMATRPSRGQGRPRA
ncbi:hypothetical protein [Burkholderia anthina]|uniref:hypothetical protein n=1 Tax=Burkholderia anthina TaxID=179879 RepID=UPI001AA07227|nr:hypothetical protein [Burkholderia anthina]QTD91797.1 hypothetical protein J4G50_26460 [Burkholderia anthina]